VILTKKKGNKKAVGKAKNKKLCHPGQARRAVHRTAKQLPSQDLSGVATTLLKNLLVKHKHFF